MSFQVGIGVLGGTVFFSSGTLYPSVNYGVNRNFCWGRGDFFIG